jgi:hypothetical protein
MGGLVGSEHKIYDAGNSLESWPVCRKGRRTGFFASVNATPQQAGKCGAGKLYAAAPALATTRVIPLLHHYPVSTEPEETWEHGPVMLWLDENCGAGGWVMAPAGFRGVVTHAVGIYFLDASPAIAFVARWCAGYKVESANGAFRVRKDAPLPRVPTRPSQDALSQIAVPGEGRR